jgi:hypothetical protein
MAAAYYKRSVTLPLLRRAMAVSIVIANRGYVCQRQNKKASGSPRDLRPEVVSSGSAKQEAIAHRHRMNILLDVRS